MSSCADDAELEGACPHAPLIVPEKDIHLPLVRPILRPGYQSMPHRVRSNVLPFAGIRIANPHLRIPEIPLPQEIANAISEFLRRQASPVTHPGDEGFTGFRRWPAEEMHVIRKNDVPSDFPAMGLQPCLADCIVRCVVGEERTTFTRARGQEQDDCGFASVNGWVMRRASALFGHFLCLDILHKVMIGWRVRTRALHVE